MCTFKTLGEVEAALVFERAKRAVRNGHGPDDATMVLIVRWLDSAEEMMRAEATAVKPPLTDTEVVAQISKLLAERV